MPAGFPPPTRDCVLRYVLSLSSIVSDAPPINKDRANDEVDSVGSGRRIHAKVFLFDSGGFLDAKNPAIPGCGLLPPPRPIAGRRKSPQGASRQRRSARKSGGASGSSARAAGSGLGEGTRWFTAVARDVACGFASRRATADAKPQATSRAAPAIQYALCPSRTRCILHGLVYNPRP